MCQNVLRNEGLNVLRNACQNGGCELKKPGVCETSLFFVVFALSALFVLLKVDL